MGQENKHRGLIIIFTLVIFIVFLLFFPMGGTDEYYFQLAWTRDVPEQFVFPGSRPKNLGFPFRSDTMFGSISAQGDILYAEPVVFDTTGSRDYFINYSSVSENLIIKNRFGDIVASIPTTGYPLIMKNRLFVFHRDRCGVSEWDFDGTLLWRKRFPTLLTSFDCNAQQVIIGQLNGEICIYDTSQRTIFRDIPSGSRVLAVYGCAISESGEYFATVLGIDPQRLVVYQMKDEGYVPVISKNMGSEIRREIYLDFSDDGENIFFEDKGGFGRLNIKRKNISRFQTGGIPVETKYIEKIQALFIHTVSSAGDAVDVFSDGGNRINRYPVAKKSSVVFTEDSIIFQYNGVLYRIDIGGLKNE